MKYSVKQFSNGKYGVVDAADPIPVSAGMSFREAETFCERLNLRQAWGK
jgi:hypothetical protein